MYAQLCKRLSKEAPSFADKDEPCTFLRLLLNVCRDKFQNRAEYAEKIYQADNLQTSDDDEKKHVAKQKILGNIKFIGELFKLDMLNESVLHTMLQQLLDKHNRFAGGLEDRCEDMECLSQLIRTCGKQLDSERGRALIDQYFDRMELKSSSPKYPPRIRFLLRDVIELRRNHWVPRKIARVDGPVPIQDLSTDEDIIRQRTKNMNLDMYRNNNNRGDDRDGNNWLSKLPLSMQPNMNFGSLTISNPTPLMNPYSNQSNYNRDQRDNGNFRNNNNSYNNHRQGASGGGQHNNYNNMRNNNNSYNNNNSKNGSSSTTGINTSHNNSNNMLNNKELAPRFKRNLMTTTQNPVEDLQMRPAANSLLFKANMSIKTNQLPLQVNVGPKPVHNNNQPMQQMHTQSTNHNNNNHNADNLIPFSISPKDPKSQTPTSQSLGSSPVLKYKAPTSPVHSSTNGKVDQQLLTKQGSAEKNAKKKDKGPTKEEMLKKVAQFVTEVLLDKKFIEGRVQKEDNHVTEIIEIDGEEPIEKIKTVEDVVQEWYELKVSEKFLKDCVAKVLNEALDKSDTVHATVIEFLQIQRKDNRLQNSQIVEAFRVVINGMSEKEKTIPKVTTLVASLLARAIASKLSKIQDVASYTDNGQHYPLFLLVLQQLHKTIDKAQLSAMFGKIDLIPSLPESDRTKDRMAEILDDRNLSFLYPLLRVESELWKQIQCDSQPQTFYKWIKDNVDSTKYSDPGFITALMTVLLKFISQESILSEGNDASKIPEKVLIEKERKLLESYSPILNAFLEGNLDLQLIAIYGLQVYCFSLDFPKGMLLRWFTALYELSIVEEDAFLRWKEDITDTYAGKGKALFQVNSWLTWLQEAESEDEDEEE